MVPSSCVVGALCELMLICNVLLGKRRACSMLRRCFAPGPFGCLGQTDPSLPVRFHLYAPHVMQKRTIVPSLTVDALTWCLPKVCWNLTASGNALLALRLGCCILRLAGRNFCFGCTCHCLCVAPSTWLCTVLPPISQRDKQFWPALLLPGSVEL